MQIDPIISSTASGISALTEYGILGAVACVCLGVSIMAVWVLLTQAKACFEGTKQAVDNNTQALHGVQLALAKIEARISK